MIEDFAHAIATAGSPAGDGHEGLRSLALVEAVYAAGGQDAVEVA
jgi:predicted dehydrogenase